MKVIKTFKISLKALGDRKVRTSLTILMVVVGSSLMVTLNGIVAGLGQFATDVFNKLAPNILFITSIPTVGSEHGGDGDNTGGPPSFLGQGLVPVPAITLDQAVVDKLKSLPHVNAVIPSYQARITIAVENRSQAQACYRYHLRTSRSLHRLWNLQQDPLRTQRMNRQHIFRL